MSTLLIRKTNLLKNSVFSSKHSFLWSFNKKCSDTSNKFLSDKDGEEIEIPVPWGHIAGVYYGPKTTQPILALHGWQDNANTWKPLINHISADTSVLAIDFPGHGKSSWLPPGMFYSHFDSMLTVKRIIKFFGWKSFSVMGHSMGAITSFVYGSLYPEEIKHAILVDNIKPLRIKMKDPLDKLSKELNKFFIYDHRNIEKNEPPVYSYDAIIQRMHEGFDKSIDIDKCHIMFERGVSRSLHDPEKYYFRRDARLKSYLFFRISQEEIDAMITKVNFPILHFKFQSSMYFEPKENYVKYIEKLKESNDRFEVHSIPGTHHGHMNNPENLGPIINDFLKKYK